MSRSVILHCPVTLLIVTLAAGTTLRAMAADNADPAPPPGRPSREEMREQLKGLTPAERQAKLRELREKAGGPPLGEEAQKRMVDFRKFRESVRDLPPPEREMKIREYREKNMIAPLRPSILTPEERQSFRAKFSERIQDHLDALQKKKAAGTLTEAESRRIQNMEQMAARLKSRGEKSGKDDAPGNLGLPPPRPASKPTPPSDNK